MTDLLRQVKFGTKAETLARLRPLLKKSYVLPLIHFSLKEWSEAPDRILSQVKENLPFSESVIVRSSARNEDAADASHAGAYVSIGNVPPESELLKIAIEQVWASYNSSDETHQIFIQQHLIGIRLSGVLFSKELGSLAPYHVFNYDDRSHSTSSVTSGAGDRLRTYVRFSGARTALPTPDLKRVFAALKEWTAFLGDEVEYELAVDADGEVCLFQARPIAARPPAPCAR